MVLLWVIAIGFVIGVVAKLLTPGRDPGGFLVTSAVGVAGSILASYLGHFMGVYHAGERAGFVGAVIGSILILAAYHALRR